MSYEQYEEGKPARRKTRAVKAASGAKPTPKASEVAKVSSRLNSFIPTLKQKEYIQTIEDNVVTFCQSPAGTGKTSAALFYFCKQYLNDPSMQIIVTRPAAECSKDKIGYLPSDQTAKLEPHYASTKKILCDFLGPEKVEADLNKRIKFYIPNFLLGATMSNTLWLIDEAQLLEPIIMKLLLERIGENTKVVVSGAASQIYTADKGRGGMLDAMNKFFNQDGSSRYPDFALFNLGVEDVMRSEVVKNVLRAYGEA